MAWSTRELAELAGATVKTVRYYHRIGLLDEPERAANGYKRYQVAHLIRLLRIRRLVDLGVALSDIPAVEESDETAEQALRALDAELAASIERQRRMREDLALVLRHRALADLPPGFDATAADLPDADRSLLLVYSRLFDPAAMAALRELHSAPRAAVETEFDSLADDAPDDLRQRLAERLVPEVRRQMREHPPLQDAAARSPHGAEYALSVIAKGVVELYNPAQLDVMRRLGVLLRAGG
jgi:DNA-binding transcriptional MerR regulator